MADCYPRRAFFSGIEGSATVKCHVASNGSLKECVIITETPPGELFGAATIAVAEQSAIEAGKYGPETTLDVPMTWMLP